MFEEITPDTAGVEYCREKLEGFLDKEYADGLKTIIDSVNAVKTAEFKIAFDPTLVRGMSYYTGPIFEIAMDEYGGSVGGGGRYDEMIGKFTGTRPAHADSPSDLSVSLCFCLREITRSRAHRRKKSVPD